MYFKLPQKQFHIFTGCSDLPASGFWPDTCGMLQQQKVQDKFLEETAEISIISLQTDKYFDLEGIILCLSLQCPEEVTQSNYCSSMLQFNNTIASSHSSAFSPGSKANTSLPQKNLVNWICSPQNENISYRQHFQNQVTIYMAQEAGNNLVPAPSPIHQFKVCLLAATRSTSTAVQFILWLPLPSALDPIY